MFFVLSKLLVVFVRPLFWVALLLIWALLTKKAGRKKVLVWVSLALVFLCSNKVLVNEMALLWEPLKNDETAIPRTAVLLGGFSKYDEYRRQIAITEAGERLFKTIELYRNKVIDTIIISGGAASLTGQIRPESIYAREYLIRFGVDSSRILIDSKSKNTYENAVETEKILIKEGGMRKVLLITSAFHIPRAVKTFQKAGISVVPFGVQFISNPKRGYNVADFVIPSSEALYHFDALMKEWVGYMVYRITGKA